MMRKVIKSSLNLMTYRLQYRNIFAKVPLGPPDPIVDITINYNNDNH
jgi:hypothetical protein